MIRFEIPRPIDAERLTDVQVKTFDDDARRFFNRPSCGPPNYNSLKTQLHYINNNIYLKDSEIIGGINIHKINDVHYQLQTIFLNPDVQNKGSGQKAIDFIKQEFLEITKWTLDTPSPRVKNHHLYKKTGYQKVNELVLDEKLYLYFYEKVTEL